MPPPFLYKSRGIMAKAKKIEQPGLDAERELNDIVNNSKDIVTIRKRKWKVGWMRNRAKRKMTDILLNEKEDDKVNSKCAAALLLNGYFKIFFFYEILWRWFYYVKQYSDEELLPVIELCKKKVQVEAYCATTILLTEMKDTIMIMTREEVSRIRQESIMAQRGRSEKNTNA